MALGAERRRLIWMVLREGFAMSAVGLAVGLPVALATTRFVKSFLFDMKPNDPWAMTIGCERYPSVTAACVAVGSARVTSGIA